MLKIKAILGGWGRIVSCPLRVDQVQIIFLVFHTIQIQMRNTSWHSHAWWFKESSGPCFQSFVFCFQSCFFGYIFVSNPDFQVFTFCSQSMFFVWSRFFIQVFWFSVFIPVSDPSFFGLISVPNSGFLVFWIHLFSRFPIHISAAQSTAILRLITWVFNQKIRNYKQMQITKYWDHLVHQVKGWLDLCKALRILELLKVIRHVATLHLIKKDIICIWARKTLLPLIKKKKKSSQPKHCLRRTSIS